MRRAALLSLLLASLPALTAQNSEPDAGTLRATTQAVAVDIVVTGEHGDTVSGLDQKQFELLEDGKPQRIDLFEEHSAPTAPAQPAAELPPGVFTNDPRAPQSGAVNVLLIDGLNTTPADQMNLLRQVAGFLVQLKAGERVAVFSLTNKLRLIQGFTTDPEQLRASLEGQTAKTTPIDRTRTDKLAGLEEVQILAQMTGNSDGGNQVSAKAQAQMISALSSYQAEVRSSITLDALRQLARYLGGVSGRKNLIWFASNFPIAMSQSVVDRQVFLQGPELGKSLRQTSGMLMMARVALYPVSAEGLLAEHAMEADTGLGTRQDDTEAIRTQEAGERNLNAATMEQLARDTGGKAYYFSNDLAQEAASAVRDGSHSYSIVYTPQNHKMDGNFRRIEVRVPGGNYKLTYRRGYFATPPEPAASDPLAHLLAHGLPSAAQIRFAARLNRATQQPAPGAPRAGGNAKLSGPLVRYTVDLTVPAGDLALDTAADGTRTGKLEVAVVAYDANGVSQNWSESVLGLSLPAAAFANGRKLGIPAHLELDLPGAAKSVVAGVYDQSAARAGTLEIPLSKASGQDH